MYAQATPSETVYLLSPPDQGVASSPLPAPSPVPRLPAHGHDGNGLKLSKFKAAQ